MAKANIVTMSLSFLLIYCSCSPHLYSKEDLYDNYYTKTIISTEKIKHPFVNIIVADSLPYHEKNIKRQQYSYFYSKDAQKVFKSSYDISNKYQSIACLCDNNDIGITKQDSVIISEINKIVDSLNWYKGNLLDSINGFMKVKSYKY